MNRHILALDGKWAFWQDPLSSMTHDQLPEQERSIQVPAPWQACAEDLRDYAGTGWYQRIIQLPETWIEDGQIWVQFGAVNYQAEVWGNGTLIGSHTGGYLPFALEFTHAARAGENTLTVRVTNAGAAFDEVPHGKQSWYGLISGLWQPVQLAHLPARHLLQPAIHTRHNHMVEIHAAASQPLAEGEQIQVEILSARGDVCAAGFFDSQSITIDVADPLLWDVGAPNLYTVRLTWLDAQDRPLDSIDERFGFRTIETRGGSILLNGRPLYIRAALDQDYYPHSIATPPSLEYLHDQFRQALSMGLNMLRVHIKIADPRYYQAADETGLLLWSELPNFALLTERAKTEARATLQGMLQRDGNHPSIVVWTIINESWGVDLTNTEHRAWLAQTYHWLKDADPTRLVVDNSACAGNAHVITDLADFHFYAAMPDHAAQFSRWVETYASRPSWLFCPESPGADQWRRPQHDPWQVEQILPRAREAIERGDEPLLVSEFGNWGLPDLAKLIGGYGGQEPWWFETGAFFGEGVVTPHGVAQRFSELALDRSFANLSALSAAHQRLQFDSLKRQIEQIRRHRTIQGYVITEFTDVHWECNGLLDLHRNPKAGASDYGWLNPDDLIVTEMERSVLWSGEGAWVRLYVSHYSPLDLQECILEWSLDGFAEIHGQQRGLGFAPYTVSPMGGLRIEVPQVAQPVRTRLQLWLRLPSGMVIARGAVDLSIFPAELPALDGLTVHVQEDEPGLADRLQRLGCRLVKAGSARLIAASTLTDETRAALLAGQHVLWLAEQAGALETDLPGLQLVDRDGTPWQGDWASTCAWIHKQPFFPDLPGDSLVDFQFEHLTPQAVFTGLPLHAYASQVSAGMAVGWLHRPAATILQQTIGRGLLTACSFRLREQYHENPLAVYLLRQLAAAAAQEA